MFCNTPLFFLSMQIAELGGRHSKSCFKSLEHGLVAGKSRHFAYFAQTVIRIIEKSHSITDSKPLCYIAETVSIALGNQALDMAGSIM